MRHDKRCLFCSDRCDSFGHRHVFISREQLASQQLDLCEFLYATQGSRPYHSDQHSQLYLRPQLASHDRCLGLKPLSSLGELQRHRLIVQKSKRFLRILPGRCHRVDKVSACHSPSRARIIRYFSMRALKCQTAMTHVSIR